ncbi:MAG: PAS domain-containing protein [Burkholderiaceae bacterium]
MLVVPDCDCRRISLRLCSSTRKRMQAEQVISRQGVLIEITEVTEQVLVEFASAFCERRIALIRRRRCGKLKSAWAIRTGPQVERLFGYSVEEWRADPGFWRAHVHPDDLEQALLIDDAAYNAAAMPTR